MRMFALLFALCLSPIVGAQEDAAEAGDDPVQAFINTLKFQDGKVSLPVANATLNLPASFRYLDANDAERVLTDLWGNPPGSEAIGMLVPSAISLADDQRSWAIILQYDNDGYVSDEDAKEIDYQELLEDMQASAKASNKERKKQGYGALDIVGWAESPRYDAASHKMHWAKELAVEEATENTLNYDVRVLGRSGVLTMRAVSGMSQMGAIKPSMVDAIDAVEFNPGARYADFNPATDHVAEYGLAALVAGGIAAKSGLLTKLLALLIAGKKLVIGAVVVIGAGISKLFGKKKEA